MTKSIVCGWAVLMLLTMGGCASLAHGTRESIEAVSDPAGADVAIHCKGQRIVSGVTPTRLTMPRKLDGCEARFSKEGSSPVTVPMPRGFSRNYWGNLVLSMGFPTGLLLAISDGFMGPYQHETEANILASLGLAGGVGLIVDRANGAMYDHPATVTARLPPAASVPGKP